MDCNIILKKYNKILNSLSEKKKELFLSNDSPLLQSYLIKDFNNTKNDSKNILEKYNLCKKNNINKHIYVK
tara:strand:+ start:541 stop:753 length:213 start_codon:yes stop_codon:yes gene_type:complete